MVRYADDIVVGFQHKADAERFRTEMAQRLATFVLSLHPDKTRLIEFGRSAASDRARRGLGKPETWAWQTGKMSLGSALLYLPPDCHASVILFH